MSPTEELLVEACELLEDCFAAMGDDMRKRVSPNLLKWWNENNPEIARKRRRAASKSQGTIRIIDRTRS
jgi:hypothetical protein